MQTFLPYEDFANAARCLDNARLGKQRIEAKTILNILMGKKSGWANHPATKMWRGHEGSLCLYLKEVILEWTKRGFKNECQRVVTKKGKVWVWTTKHGKPRMFADLTPPPWLGNAAFHSSHRSNLLRKKPEWYSQFGWKDDPTAPYVWPDVSSRMETSST